MRILQSIISKGFRGAERHVAELAGAQAQRHDVLLVIRDDCADESGASIRAWLPPQVRTIGLRRPWWIAQSWRALRAFRPDIVHTHGGRAGRLFGWLAGGVPKVATIHLDYRAKAHRRHDALICPTAHQRDGALAGGFTGESARIGLWSTPHPRLSPEAVAGLRSAFQAAPGTFVIGAVAQLIPAKGLDLLIAAFRAVPRDDILLVIAGDGPERAALAAQAAGDGRIRLLGFRADARDLYQAFDLFVSPARLEPFGLVFLEALDAGVPIVATKTAGAKEILPGYPAELIPAGDVRALADSLARNAAVRPPCYRADLTRFARETRLAEIEALYERLRRRTQKSSE